MLIELKVIALLIALERCTSEENSTEEIIFNSTQLHTYLLLKYILIKTISTSLMKYMAIFYICKSLQKYVCYVVIFYVVLVLKFTADFYKLLFTMHNR